MHGYIDVLVNNAKIHPAKGILDAGLVDWNRVMVVNNVDVWLGMKPVIPHTKAQGCGSIIDVS